ncbi:MAG: hypothetical protein LBL79_06680 [Prevotella sp.]|jgi:hypothetical protein|nr:hypothetical protein [Prevotella sp.]
MKKTVLLVVLVIFTFTVYGQEYMVPKNVKFENKEDYAAYEPQVKETINWLLATSLGKEANKRTEANAFLIMWLTGTPDVSINVNTDILPFIKKSPELLIPFIAGCIKYSLENNYSKDNILLNKAGIETIVAFYRNNRGYLKKDDNIEKYEKLMEKGKLEEDIRKKIAKTLKN